MSIYNEKKIGSCTCIYISLDLKAAYPNNKQID